MTRYSGLVDIGDVLVTREGPWYVSMAIRLGAWLQRKPSLCNHTIIVHHIDNSGVIWGIEGRPGGVGWVDISNALASPWTNANNQQPKTEPQRYLIAVAAESLLHVAYDWEAIAEDAAHVWMAGNLWKTVERSREWAGKTTPGHVVCSSFADWCYEQVGLPNPGGSDITRFTTPADWDEFIIKKGWQ